MTGPGDGCAKPGCGCDGSMGTSLPLLADRVMGLIAADMATGGLPAHPLSFDVLYRYVDANEYLITATADCQTDTPCGCEHRRAHVSGGGWNRRPHADECPWWEDDNRLAIEAWLALGNAVAELASARLWLFAATPGHEGCAGWFTFHERRLPSASVYACAVCGQHRVAQDDPQAHASAMERLADALTAAAQDLG